MATKREYSGYNTDKITVPAFSTSTINFSDAIKPNYFRVQNSGKSAIFASTSNYPNDKHYDFKIEPENVRMFVDPFQRACLHLHNASGSPIDVTVVSFMAEFDPLALALGDIKIEVPETLTTSTAINQFKASLPAGTNKIGKVSVDNLIDYTTLFNNVISAINNKTDNEIDYTELLTAIKNKSLSEIAVNNLIDYNTKLDNILTAISNISVSGGGSNGGGISSLHNKDILLKMFDCLDEEVEYYCSDNEFISKINFISNDGTSDVNIEIYNKIDNSKKTLSLKPGEVLNDLDIYSHDLYIDTSGTSARVAYTLVKEGA